MWTGRGADAFAEFLGPWLWDATPASERELIAVARGILRDAIRYAPHLPRQEVGIRRFLAWAIGLALPTLRKIQHHPDSRSGGEVEVSRRKNGATVVTTHTVIGNKTGLMAP